MIICLPSHSPNIARFLHHSAQFQTSAFDHRQGAGQELGRDSGAEKGAQRERAGRDFAEQLAGDHPPAQPQAREHRPAEGSGRRAEA